MLFEVEHAARNAEDSISNRFIFSEYGFQFTHFCMIFDAFKEIELL